MNNRSVKIKNAFDIYRFSESDMYSFLFTTSDTALHTHEDFYEFTLVTIGEFNNVYQGSNLILPKNSLIFFKPNQTHAFYSHAPGSIHFSFVVKISLFEDFFAQYFPQYHLANMSNYIERHLDPIQAEYLAFLAKQLTDNGIQDNRNQLMQVFLFNALSTILMKPLQAPALTSTDQYVEDLLKRFNNFLYIKHRVNEIYLDYPVAPSVLIRAFKKRTGQTIVQYHTMKKLDYAAQLLSCNSVLMDVTEVCFSLNFSSLSYFSSIFKKRFQVSPSQYQRLHSLYRLPNEELIGKDV